MNTFEKHTLYASLARQTEHTVELLDACGMTEQANRHRECAALLSVLAMRFARGGVS
jgi:hypothetical protein